MNKLFYTKRDRKSMLAIISLIFGIGLIVTFGSKSSGDFEIDFSEFNRKVDSIEQYSVRENIPLQSHTTPKIYNNKSSYKPKTSKLPNIPKHKDTLFQKSNLFQKAKYSQSKNIDKSKSKYIRKRDRFTKLDINRSDDMDWESLRGIGPYYARLITNFRDKLGGFTSIEQISETYNLPDSTFKLIKPHLEVSPVFERIDINQADEERLKRHPYINWREAKLIVRYRDEHGPYHFVEELNKIRAFDESWLSRIYPYLKVISPVPNVVDME